MKKNSVIFIFTILSAIGINAQTEQALVAGVKNNQFPFLAYAFNSTFNVGLMNSLFIREPVAQYARLFGGYNLKINEIKSNLSILPYVGINYGAAYFDAGTGIKFDKLWFQAIETTAQLTPFYDSSIGFYCSYTAVLGYRLNNIVLTAKITDYPEFRQPEDRVVFATMFSVSSLVVKPELSIPLHGDIRTSRFQLSFLYNFISGSETKTLSNNILY